MKIIRNLFRQTGHPARAGEAPSAAELLQRARDSLAGGNFAGAELACEECLANAPDNADALHLLGLVAYRTADWDRALALFLRSLERDPGNAEFLNNLGSLYTVLGFADDAAAALRRAISIDPQLASARENLLFVLPFLERTRGGDIRAEAETWARLHANTPRVMQKPRIRGPSEPLRIGYVSADFREHAVSFFIEPVIASHDPVRFEVYCYYSGVRHDGFTARIRSAAHRWRDIAPLDDERAAQIVSEDRIDILVDLSGHLRGNRLGVFARKPAPLQMTWLGYLATTGLSAIDYRITDAICDPPGLTEGDYTEQLLRLPDCMWCYRPPADAPPVGPLPAVARGLVTFGSTNNPAKITGRMLELWSRILREVERSRLLVAGVPGPGRERIRKGLGASGIAPERLVFHDRLTRAQFLALHSEIDVLLDTFPYNGGTTLCDALWQGVPGVCLTGAWMPARSAASLYSAIGLEALAVRSEAEYVEAAVRLARNLDATAALRAGMRERMRASPLLDARGFTRGLEAVYEQAWQLKLTADDGR